MATVRKLLASYSWMGSSRSVRSAVLLATIAVGQSAFAQAVGDTIMGIRVGVTASTSNNVSPANVVNGVNFVSYRFDGTTWNAGTAIAASPTGSGALTISATATSEGALSISSNARYLGVAGYRTGTNGGTTDRVIGRFDLSSNTLNTSSAIPSSEGYSGNNIRSAVWNTSGDRFWTAGTGTGGGTRTNTFGATSGSTQVSNSITNTRVVGIFGSQLYTTSGSGAFLGVSTVGTGLPTTSGNSTTAIFDNATGLSSYGFSISPDGLTAYVADDRTDANGGIQKWARANTSVNFAFVTVFGTGITNIGARGISVDWLKTNPVIYASTASPTNNRFIVFQDIAGTQTALTTISDSGAGDIFRGIQVVPEPAGIVTFIGTAVTLIRRRRQR